MARKKRTEDQVREAARQSYSITGMCRQLGLVPAGGNFASVKRLLARYNIDTSHFTGRAWNTGNYSDAPNSKTSIKAKLIRERGHQCEKCKNGTWLGVPICLELEHIDGNNTNNNNNNLLLLCPNCHAQTPTWRRAKSSFGPNLNQKLICPSCGEPKTYRAKKCRTCWSSNSMTSTAIREKSKISKGTSAKTCPCGASITTKSQKCVKCAHTDQHRIVWPTLEDLLVRLRDHGEPYTRVAKALGVTDNSVRKFVRKNGIDPKTFLPIVES